MGQRDAGQGAGAESVVTLLRLRPASTIDRTLVLGLPDADRTRFSYLPGQFVTLRDPGFDPRRRRAYSLSYADRRDGLLRLTVRDMGTFGAHLYRLQPGHELMAQPPRGRFVLDLEDDAPLLLVAGGAGVTPFHAYVEALAARESERPWSAAQPSSQRPSCRGRPLRSNTRSW